MLSSNALKYTIDHLFRVAFPPSGTAAHRFEVCDGMLTICFLEDYHLRIPLLTDAETDDLLSGTAEPIFISSADRKIKLPVFQSAQHSEKEVTCTYDTRTITIPYDIISLSFILLSRDEEYRGLPRDVHNRFLFNYSLAKRYEFIDIPLVDEYAILLREWILTYLKPGISIQPRRHQLIPTHDIDLLYRFTGPLQALKSIFGRDLLLHHSIDQTRSSLQEYNAYHRDPLQDPYIQAIRELVNQSVQHKLSSIFFFKSLIPKEADCTYNIYDPEVRHTLEIIQEAGMTVGLHGSYNSYNKPDVLQREHGRLSELASCRITHSRQHYLRFCQQRDLGTLINDSALPGLSPIRTRDKSTLNHHNTLQVWQMTGIEHDYTLGYAEQPGFRCGTCHPYPLYDLDNDCPTNIIEHPLIVMDGSLFDYLHLDFEQSNTLIQELNNRCKAVEGDFIILWHNHLLSRNYKQAYEQVYLPTINL